MPDEDVTALLQRVADGDRGAFGQLMPLVYEQLRRIAHRQVAGERSDHTLNTTALVHEAYLKLAGLHRLQWKNRAQFYAIAAQAMRRILVDYAKQKKAQKRGRGEAAVALDYVELAAKSRADDLLQLEDALERLEKLNPRQAKVVEYRFFAGMTVDETADVLQVSPITVKRDWQHARAWLNRELRS